MGFKLIRIDSEEPAKIPLKIGTQLIGRGSILNCEDLRVSRHHALITVTEGTVKLKALHQNPCFYNKLHLRKKLVLSQGESVTLLNTDYFGLLPFDYWYELIFCNDDNPDEMKQQNSMNSENSVVNIFSNQYNNCDYLVTEEKLMPRVPAYAHFSTEPYNYKSESDSDSDTIDMEANDTMEDRPGEPETQSLITDNPVSAVPNTLTSSEDPDTTQPPSNDSDGAPDVQTPGKRSHAPEPHHDAKKIKMEPESLDTSGIPNDPTTEEPKEPNTQPSPIELQSSMDVNTDPQRTNDVNTDPQNPSDKEPQSPKVNEDQNTMDVNLEPRSPNASTDPESAYEGDTDPPNPDTDNETSNVKKEPQSPDVKVVKQEPQSPDVKDVKQEPQSPEMKNKLDGAKPGSSNDQPSTSGDGSAGAKPPPRPPRERCIYGADCYRKNPQHKLQFSHPCDADYGPGARGQCPYGASCRRADPRHWTHHEHPPGAAQPRLGNPAKRRRKVVRPAESEDSDQDSPSLSPNLIVHGKRKRKTVQREIRSDSEVESQDPYGTDDSDDWEPS